MSAVNENERIPNNAPEKLDSVLSTPKISYTRDLLLSLSSLDVCKKLPIGFDEALLSELGEVSQSGLDRPRSYSSLPSQGFRRTQYSSSPPSQGDSSDNSRNTHGKWDSRRSDRDSDSQSDKDSDSGRRHGHQSRGSWHNREQDGLLGSGSLVRSSGHTSGISAPKIQPNEKYQLNKSKDPYHPPRPYKAVPHTRRDTDSYNDETFGSVESTSEGRAEEERKRRASFESMRQEQQRILRENQKLNLEKHKNGGVAGVDAVLDDGKDEKELSMRTNGMELSSGMTIVSNESEKISLPSNSTASRPLVPPGFKNSTVEKTSGSKSLIHHHLSEVAEPVRGITPLDVEINFSLNGTKDAFEQPLAREIPFADGKHPADAAHTLNQEEIVPSSLDAPIQKLSEQNQFFPSNHFNSQESLGDLEKIKLDAEALEGVVCVLNKYHSNSEAEDLFDAKLSIVNNGSTTSNHHGMPIAPNSAQSSKFAQWFFEEETQLTAVPSGTPTDVLSIIVNGDKGRHGVSDMEVAEQFPHYSSYQTSEQLNQEKLAEHSGTNGISSQPFIDENIIPAVISCEDLEQSILSEYSGSSTSMPPLSSENTEQKHSDVNGYASLHLLSLLQKGTDSSINPVVNVNVANNLISFPEYSIVGTSSDKTQWEGNTSTLSKSEDKLTLEALFGSAFMNELQSVDAPVSVQGGSSGSARVGTSDLSGFPFPASDVASSTIINKMGPQKPSHDLDALSSNPPQQTRLNMNWQLSEDSPNIISSLDHTEASRKNIGLQAFSEVQLPEKNPVSSNDPRNVWISKLMPTGSSSNSNNSLDGGELVPFGDQHMVSSKNLPFTRSYHEQMLSQIPFRGPQMPQSFPQMQNPHISQVRPLYHHLDSHPANRGSDMMFLGRQETIHSHDSPAIHQFTSNVNRPSLWNTRGAEFEIPLHPSIPRHQIQSPGNRPFMFPDVSRGGPVSHHGNQSPVFMQDNQIRHLPYDPRMPNIGSRGAPFSGNPPEAFQRLIEMELLANAKQSQTHIPRHNQGNQGFHGFQPDKGFQYG